MYRQIVSLFFSSMIISTVSITAMKRPAFSNEALEIISRKKQRVEDLAVITNFNSSLLLSVPKVKLDLGEMSEAVLATVVPTSTPIIHIHAPELHIHIAPENVGVSKIKDAEEDVYVAKEVKDAIHYSCGAPGCRFSSSRIASIGWHEKLHLVEACTVSVCPTCDFRALVNKPRIMDDHKKTHMPKSERGYQCQFCNKYLSKAFSLERHENICRENPNAEDRNGAEDIFLGRDSIYKPKIKSSKR